MIEERDFLALIHRAADLDDLRLHDCFVLGRDAAGERLRTLIGSRRVERRQVLQTLAPLGSTASFELKHGAKLPAWARRLRRMLTYFEGYRPGPRGSLAQRLVAAPLAYGADEMRLRLKRHKLPLPVLRRFESQLESHLTETIGPCLDFNFRIFEAAYRSVHGAHTVFSREEIEDEYVGENVGFRLISLLQTYPVLAKLWLQLIAHWIGKIRELTARWETDHNAINRTFFQGHSSGELIDVTLNLSDPHRRGRETMILHFHGGSVVYKPRSGRSEQDWFSFVRWINRRGFKPNFVTLRLLRRPTYCWMEYVRYRPCRDRRDVRRYYRRAGALICSAHLFGAADLHRDNVIAAGDQPVFIDLETLIHGASIQLGDENKAISATSLLPLPMFSSDRLAAIAGFGGAPGKHTPTLNGTPIAPFDYFIEMERGVRAMWKLIGEPVTTSGAAFKRRLRQLRSKRWRRLYRSTKTYNQLRTKSLGADVMQSGLKRSRSIALDLLELGGDWSVVSKELNAIARYDIPCLSAAPPASTRAGTPRVTLSDLLFLICSALRPAQEALDSPECNRRRCKARSS